MRSRSRIALAVAVAGFVGIALVFGADTDATGRPNDIASRLRCVDCDHGSIADSPSVADRDMRRLIAARVDAGEDDAAIVADFVAAYGEAVLLDPRSGAGILLILIPGLVLAAGLVAAFRLLRPAGSRAPVPSTAVDRDRADLEAELAAGDLAVADAIRLRGVYRREAETGPAEPGPALPWWPVVAAAAVLAALAVVVAVRSDPGATAGPAPQTEGVAARAAASGGPDLAGMGGSELAAVVARNPDVVPLRLALARSYRDDGDLAAALGELATIIERSGPVPEALAEAGWVTYLGGDPSAGAELLEAAVVADPGLAPAWWYLGNVRFYGLDDPAGAAAAVESLLTLPDLSGDLRDAAVDLRDVIGAGP